MRSDVQRIPDLSGHDLIGMPPRPMEARLTLEELIQIHVCLPFAPQFFLQGLRRRRAREASWPARTPELSLPPKGRRQDPGPELLPI